MAEVRWERMFPDEMEAAFEACPAVYLPYGLCEPHGPQNVLGLDALKAHAICCASARKHGGIVAPVDYWHIHECGGYAVWSQATIGEQRPWLTAVPPWVHFRNVCYHIRAVDAAGFHAAILLTGHYGPNWKDLKTLVSILQPHLSTRLYALPDFEANQPGFDVEGDSGDHADKIETSLLWALEPECVDMSRLPPVGEEGLHFAMGRTAHRASRRIGERMVADEVNWLGKKVTELLAEYQAAKPAVRKRLSFADIERIWAAQVKPQLPHFESMKPLFEDQTEAPRRDSQWLLNWEIPRDFQ
jgi:creatinine amidohydrolase